MYFNKTIRTFVLYLDFKWVGNLPLTLIDYTFDGWIDGWMGGGEGGGYGIMYNI